MVVVFFFFFFKQKTAYEMRISDWSSDVCSSDLLSSRVVQRSRGRRGMCVRSCPGVVRRAQRTWKVIGIETQTGTFLSRFRAGEKRKIGRASCRERVCQYV